MADFIFYMLLPCKKVTSSFFTTDWPVACGVASSCTFFCPPGPQKKLKDISDYYYIDIVDIFIVELLRLEYNNSSGSELNLRQYTMASFGNGLS